MISSLHLHYRNFFTTTNHSAPAACIGISLLCHLLEFLPLHQVQVPSVPYKGLNQLRATSMPDAICTVNRVLADFFFPSQSSQGTSGFDVIYDISTCHRWFTCVHLSDSYMVHRLHLFRNAHYTDSLPAQLTVV